MPYTFEMKHDNRWVKTDFADETVWTTHKYEHEGRQWSVGDGRGVPIDIAVLGTVQIGIVSSHKDLEPMLPLKWRFGVSQTVKDFIEAREPSVHQFIPTRITLRDGGIPSQPYYLVNICNRLDAINGDRSNLVFDGRRYRKHPLETGPGTERMVLRADVIGDKQLWLDTRFSGLFMSDDLQAKVVSMKSTRLNFWHVEQE